MIAISIMTVGAYSVLDAFFLARSESDAYRAVLRTFGFKTYATGFVFFMVVSGIYAGQVAPELSAQLLEFPRIILFFPAGLSPVLTLAVFVVGSRIPSPYLGVAVAVAHFLVLLFNAVGRQVAQNLERAPFGDLARDRVATQWSPLMLFLVAFILGFVVVAWLLRVAFRASLARAE